MPGSLSKTKHRILAIQGTEKTTKAMELIATVKTKRLKDAFEKSNFYIEEYQNLMAMLFSHDKETMSHYGCLNKGDLPTLYIVISSNMGLCGAYNSNLFKYADSIIKPTDYIVPIGAKATHHYERNEKYLNIVGDFMEADLDLDMEKLRSFCLKLKDEFNKEKYKNICIIFTHYINSITFTPLTFQFLPVQITPKKWKNESFCPPIFDESPRDLIHSLMPDYLTSVLYGRLLESELSEQASRRTAMDNANDNADELLEKLNIEYNKARQNAITQEITEVVGGANAHE